MQSKCCGVFACLHKANSNHARDLLLHKTLHVLMHVILIPSCGLTSEYFVSERCIITANIQLSYHI